jgi:flagellin
MSLRINTNVSAINTLRNLEQTSQSIATSIERLSSGLRINRGADDPAGLIISEKLRAQIDGINQAISNAQEANNLIKTAEGGLGEINALLRSIRTLAVHAANTGVNDATAVQADQTQIASAIASIQRIATQTQFGTKNLLDGTSGISTAVVQTSIIKGIYIGGTFGGGATQTGNVTISVSTAATRAQVIGTATYASVNSSISTVNGTTTGSGGTIVINGQSIAVSGSETVQSLIDKINNIASVTGVSANFSAANGSGSIVLTQQTYGSRFSVNESESAPIIYSNASGGSDSGSDAVVSVTAQVLINGSVQAVSVNFTGGRGSTDSGLRVTDAYGNSILLTEAGNTSTSPIAAARVTAASLQFQIGANAGQYVNQTLGNVQTDQLGTTAGNSTTSLAAIDVTTADGAADALRVVDEAIQQVSVLRAQLGAFQKNTLESAIRALGVGSENLSASESQVRDTNVAKEITALTKNQILSQAGTAVLAQANAAPQLVLSLLR